MNITADFPTRGALNYKPPAIHWFYKQKKANKSIWRPFSIVDSNELESYFLQNDVDPNKRIATDGGRFDVHVAERKKYPVYWQLDPADVRRCSWFYKRRSDGHYIPYDELSAGFLEDEYKSALLTSTWQKKIDLPDGNAVSFYDPNIVIILPPSKVGWGNVPRHSVPVEVKRGIPEIDIEEGEPVQVDHLLFVVHGIGGVCDLKFQTVEEVVDDFRTIALQLIRSHYTASCQRGHVGRIEVLPISWHEELHSDETGIDEKLLSITLESIPRLREFTNDTILDVLFYTSPVYGQTIISAVGNQLNEVYQNFKKRNPNFQGDVSVVGHSLGSLILFDILSHQDEPGSSSEPEKKEETAPKDKEDEVKRSLKRTFSRRISYMMGRAGTGQPQLSYPHLDFHPKSFFALGSPIGMFVTVRGLYTLGENFVFPTCESFFNIFHPYDPVAYRIEALINPELAQYAPVLIPHHKGRKRMHLELKETMAKVGADFKQTAVDSMKSLWGSLNQLGMFRSDTSAQDDGSCASEDEPVKDYHRASSKKSFVDQVSLGNLNRGRRVDYVLQESPFELFNEYIFALRSHVCYWDSEDTVLFIVKEIYSEMGISADNQIPQQSMSIERENVSAKVQSNVVLQRAENQKVEMKIHGTKSSTEPASSKAGPGKVSLSVPPPTSPKESTKLHCQNKAKDD